MDDHELASELRDEQVEIIGKMAGEEAGHELRGYAKIILWVAIILVVIGLTSIIRSYQVADAVHEISAKADDLTTEVGAAKEASVEARDTLQKALAELEESQANGETTSAAAINDALLAIARIEQELCGGPCDQPNN